MARTFFASTPSSSVLSNGPWCMADQAGSVETRFHNVRREEGHGPRVFVVLPNTCTNTTQRSKFGPVQKLSPPPPPVFASSTLTSPPFRGAPFPANAANANCCRFFSVRKAEDGQTGRAAGGWLLRLPRRRASRSAVSCHGCHREGAHRDTVESDGEARLG